MISNQWHGWAHHLKNIIQKKVYCSSVSCGLQSSINKILIRLQLSKELCMLHMEHCHLLFLPPAPNTPWLLDIIYPAGQNFSMKNFCKKTFFNGFFWIPKLLCKSSCKWFMNKSVCTCLYVLARSFQSLHRYKFSARFSCFPLVHLSTISTLFASLLGTVHQYMCYPSFSYQYSLDSCGHGFCSMHYIVILYHVEVILYG